MQRIGFLVLAVLAAACTIDARGDEERHVVVTDAGVPIPPPPPAEGAFAITYTAPVNAGAVTFCSNFSGLWSCATATPGRSVRWTGDLDLRRLVLPACTAHVVGGDCGYVWNVSFNVPPFWAATKVGVVGDHSVSGPVSVGSAWVENGLDGSNFHLRRQ